MPSLKLENHAFRLLENELTALAFLNRIAHSWVWELDLSQGEILFREPGTGRILFSSPVKLIGTYDQSSEQFRFGWADPAIPEDWQCVTGLGRMRVTARGAGLEIFDSTAPVALRNPAQALGWALSCAGYLGAFMVFEARANHQTQLLTVEYFPDSGLIERDIYVAQRTIEDGKLRFSLNQKEAVTAYLGTPSGAGGANLADETFYWGFPEGQLRIQFAHHGQILSMDTELPEPGVAEEIPLELAPKQGFLDRLFGRRR